MSAQSHTSLAPERTDTPTVRAFNGHPLELIPFFLRWKPSPWRDLIYTFLWGSCFAVLFVMLQMPELRWRVVMHALGSAMVIAQSVSFTIHGLFELFERLFPAWLRGEQDWRRRLYYVAVPLAGVFIGYWIGFSLLDMAASRRAMFSPQGAIAITVVGLFFTGLLFYAYLTREKQMKQDAALAAEQQRVLDAERRALEAQLRMLQAQIEPHFLYNTLANAVGLIQPSPDGARLLLERLIDYLRASLTSSRASAATLEREIGTMYTYLELMKVRMGERLRYRIDLPPALADLALPPMLLQPLVENAITHGLEPKVDGGEIAIECEVDDASLVVVVADDGIGFNPAARPRPGGGVGLSNLRERLQTLYGEAASLTLADNQPCGVRVTLRLPRAELVA